ncbi:MAG: response regulator [Oscillospiraceae bacterium]|nr:response regulator [Oscillospiraceae bacterium]
MRVLLIEDELPHCEKYEKCVEHLPYTVELSVAHGFKKAAKLAEKAVFDVVLLDLELNVSDGDGIAFLQWLRATKLPYKPFIIVITNNDSRKTSRIVRNLGADYIFLKIKPDYSPRLVFDFAQTCMNSQPQEEQSQSATLEEAIAREVEKIGFTRDVIGTEYLIHAVATVIYAGKKNPSMSKDVYPVIAKAFKKTDNSICRAINLAIIRTWRITDVETLQENYTSNIDYDTGTPTNRQMVLYVADKVQRDVAGCSVVLPHPPSLRFNPNA